MKKIVKLDTILLLIFGKIILFVKLLFVVKLKIMPYIVSTRVINLITSVPIRKRRIIINDYGVRSNSVEKM